MKKFLLLTSAAIVAVMPLSAEKRTQLNEGFEAWDSVASDWLPDGWSEENSDTDLAKLNDGVFTWHVGTQNGFLPYPTEGSAYAVIYYAYTTDDSGNKTDLPQDEWLLTPWTSVSKNAELTFDLGYAPLFLFDLNTGNIDWSKNDFINKKSSTTMQILIREEGGEWEELLDIYDEWEEVPFSELFEKHSGSTFFSYKIDLAEYEEKNVQVAFRFVGMYGNTMELDAVKITDTFSSVGNIISDCVSRPSVSIIGNELHIKSEGSRYVDIFSADAGLVKSMPLNKETVLNRNTFPRGILLLRFDDGTVHKIINN